MRGGTVSREEEVRGSTSGSIERHEFTVNRKHSKCGSIKSAQTVGRRVPKGKEGGVKEAR